MTKTKTLLLIMVASFCMLINLRSQSNYILSGELQAYPTGLIPGLSADIKIDDKSYLHLRAGLNIFDHRDLGIQEEEVGNGYGFTLGMRKFLGKTNQSWRWGIKTDLWFNSVDWENTLETGDKESGNTEITVLQPTAELAYVFDKSGFIIAPSIALGAEWNIRTEGRPTGEGLILLLGIQLGKKL